MLFGDYHILWTIIESNLLYNVFELLTYTILGIISTYKQHDIITRMCTS